MLYIVLEELSHGCKCMCIKYTLTTLSVPVVDVSLTIIYLQPWESSSRTIYNMYSLSNYHTFTAMDDKTNNYLDITESCG
jgi:hypothetical protein